MLAFDTISENASCSWRFCKRKLMQCFTAFPKVLKVVSTFPRSACVWRIPLC